MISIIGGGPAGAYSAYLLAKENYDVDIYEEHQNIGIPIQCTGIVTSTIKDIFQIKPEIIVNKIKIMKITSPEKKSLEIKLKEPDLVLDRTKFDQDLIQKAVDKGAGVFYNHRLTQIENKKLKFSINGESKFVNNSKYIIGADGPLSVVGKSINSAIKKFFIGSQVIVKGNFEKEIVETFIFQQGFGWIVPENENYARIGIFSYNESNVKLDKFLKEKRLDSQIITKQGGLIPLYNPNLKTYKNNTYLIGDAAGMVKATTGGGIIPSLKAAEQLAKSIKTKQNYEKLWKYKIGKSLNAHLYIRKALDKFDDPSLNRLIQLSMQDKMQDILATYTRDDILKVGFKTLITEPRYLFFLRNLI